MAKIELYKKRYAIHGKVEMSILLPVNKSRLRINFTNGIINADGITPATFTTSDAVIQTAIENSDWYLKGFIKLNKKHKIGEMEILEPISEKEPSKNTEDNPKADNDRTVSYPDVKNAQSAREVLIRDYGVSITELQDKERIKSKAGEVGVQFPNWN